MKVIECDSVEEAKLNADCQLPTSLPFSVDDTTVGHTHTIEPPSVCATATNEANENLDSPDVVYLYKPTKNEKIRFTICPTTDFECVFFVKHCDPDGNCDDIEESEALCTAEAEVSIGFMRNMRGKGAFKLVVDRALFSISAAMVLSHLMTMIPKHQAMIREPV
mgnify:CR=1 FL=1